MSDTLSLRPVLHVARMSLRGVVHGGYLILEAQLLLYWVPVLKPLYDFTLSVTQGPTISVPGLLG